MGKTDMDAAGTDEFIFNEYLQRIKYIQDRNCNLKKTRKKRNKNEKMICPESNDSKKYFNCVTQINNIYQTLS